MFIVRAVTDADAAAFSEICDGTTPQDWGTLGSHVSRSLLALDTESVPVGLLEARRSGDDVEIIMIATRPTARRQGVAMTLLDKLLEQSRAEGAARVILDVAQDNDPALNLYARFGFIEIARRPGYYRATGSGEPRDALLMARCFASADT